MSDRDPSEARRTCVVCLRAPHFHGFLGKVRGRTEAPSGQCSAFEAESGEI